MRVYDSCCELAGRAGLQAVRAFTTFLSCGLSSDFQLLLVPCFVGATLGNMVCIANILGAKAVMNLTHIGRCTPHPEACRACMILACIAT
jgi:hypothetical protein